jgi:hypothetical protein
MHVRRRSIVCSLSHFEEESVVPDWLNPHVWALLWPVILQFICRTCQRVRHLAGGGSEQVKPAASGRVRVGASGPTRDPPGEGGVDEPELSEHSAVGFLLRTAPICDVVKRASARARHSRGNAGGSARSENDEDSLGGSASLRVEASGYRARAHFGDDSAAPTPAEATAYSASKIIRGARVPKVCSPVPNSAASPAVDASNAEQTPTPTAPECTCTKATAPSHASKSHSDIMGQTLDEARGSEEAAFREKSSGKKADSDVSKLIFFENLFFRLDVDGSGTIAFDEMRRMFSFTAVGMTMAEIDEALLSADVEESECVLSLGRC